jgi:deoxyribodipyrimidine photolyase-related protein
MRHFAEELVALGWKVDYYHEQANFQSAIRKHLDKYSPDQFVMMEQSEYGATKRFTDILKPIPVQVTKHSHFISTAEEFESLHKNEDSRVTMENFYRLMRRKTNLLMDGKEPEGGEWNYDKENRKPPVADMQWKELLQFPPDEITRDVIAMVERNFADHPGSTADWKYAVTRDDAIKAAQDFFENRLQNFGAYQDAMLDGEPFLNHSVLSPYINTCLLHPLELAAEAEKQYRMGRASLSSAEGFIRQLIGWREFIWRVYWRMMPEYRERNALNANQKLPQMFKSGETKMNCLHDAFRTVEKYGYAHHIVRLMLLGNFALIAGLDPIETNEWFNCMFVDAYDWVMVPNVIGMTLHADGGYVGTKPYAASANYINKMSNYCKGCAYNHRETTGENACPFNFLYWDFLMRNEKKFAGNKRMALVMKSLEAKTEQWKQAVRKQARQWLAKLDIAAI